MKINLIKLKNFSAIKNAMNANEIEIDFSEAKNKICLLIGENGCGKTSLLSQLHPFADVGNLDVRNGNDLILKDKEGYKEIHIIKNNDYYIIKHFYYPHKDKSHSVKSYISKNGNELNDNGNVTSFKEFVKLELQIEPDYLKLIRLGNNVTSLIDLTATERKNFMSKIMDDVDIYLEYYKSVNNKLRQLDEMISHSVDKLNKLNIIDKSEYEKDIKRINEELKIKEELYIELNGKLSVNKDKILSIDDVDNLQTNLSDAKKKYNKMIKVIEKKNELDNFDANYYKEELDKLSKNEEFAKIEIASNNNIISNTMTLIDELIKQKRNYDINIRKVEESSNELKQLRDKIESDKEKLKELNKNIDDNSFTFTKTEFEEFMTSLKTSQTILNTTYGFGKKPINKVISLLEDKKDVPKYINSHMLNLSEKSSDVSTLFLQSLVNKVKLGEDVVIQCKEECMAKNLFNQIKVMLEDSHIDDKEDTYDFYHDMEMVYCNLMRVLPRFIMYKDIICQLPDDIKNMFLLNNIYDNIKKTDNIYDEKKLNDILSIVIEIEYRDSLKEEISSNESRLKLFDSSFNISDLYEQAQNIEDSISDKNKYIRSLKERNKLLAEQILEIKNTTEVYSDILETIEKFDEVSNLYKKYSDDYALYTNLQSEIYDISVQLSNEKNQIENIKVELQKRISNLDQYDSITKELDKMNKIYDDITLVKESLSSKKGIPLYFISNYLSNTEEITNELLDVVYNGRIYIDNFNITPTEFAIPFYNSGVRLSDVKYASQGELSFLSIALSFALSSQALSKYNIMLLDEIDGPLDTKNREKFIQILENQIDRISSEQSFLITHNDMFSSYPVDIIDLSDININDYSLANKINIKKK